MTLSHTIDRDAEIIAAACVEAFKRAGIPTSVAVDDPDCLAKVATALDELVADLMPPSGSGVDSRSVPEPLVAGASALSAIKGDG